MIRVYQSDYAGLDVCIGFMHLAFYAFSCMFSLHIRGVHNFNEENIIFI